MPDISAIRFASSEPRGTCRGCGTSIPHSEIILRTFRRCYYCGMSHPFGIGRRGLALQAAFATLAVAAAMWWTQPFS